MLVASLLYGLVASLAPAPAVAEAIAKISKVITALANVDYARAHCPSLTINETELGKMLATTRTTPEMLRATQDYHVSTLALSGVEAGLGKAALCQRLSQADGGFARQVYREP